MDITTCFGGDGIIRRVALHDQKPEPILLVKILHQVAGLSRIHAAQSSFSFS